MSRPPSWSHVRRVSARYLPRSPDPRSRVPAPDPVSFDRSVAELAPPPFEPGGPRALAGRLALSRALAARGDVEDGVAVLRELLSLHPDDLEARTTLGRVLAAAGRGEALDSELSGLIEALERRGVPCE